MSRIVVPVVSLPSSRSVKIFIAVPQRKNSILDFMKEAGRWLVALKKRAAWKGTLSGMIMATAAFGALPVAEAATVTITITGTLGSGTDYTGVFGFPPKTDLTNQPFSVTFTFDDTKGQSNDIPTCESEREEIYSQPGSSPGTAVLSIGSKTWSFGTLPLFSKTGALQDSLAQRIISPCNGGGRGVMNVGVSDTNNTPYPQGFDKIFLNVIPQAGSPQWQDYVWEDALSSPVSGDEGTQSVGDYSGSDNDFEIVIDNPNGGPYTDEAEGSFLPTNIIVSGSQSGSGTTTGLQFIPVTPCRVADTRNATGAFGGPELAAATSREFDIPQSACSIPSSALAYSLNVTAVPSGPLGYLTLWPTGQTQPTVSTLNSDGRVKANAAIVPAGTNGGVSVFVTNKSHVILDIDGYFVPAGTASALAFYPLTPCRVVDTRNASGSLGGPSIGANASRNFPIQSSNCAVPSDAKAYSLNVTAVPKGSLGYLTLWPTGETQPLVSTLNSPTGAVTANAAIVPAGSNGGVSVFVTGQSDVVLDVNGYFAAPAADGLSLYATTPCRVIDTRNNSGAFNGVLAVAVESSTCAPSSTAQAYVLNATVVPSHSLGYLTLWPAGETQPVVSTLNAVDGAVTSNMAIAPTVNGSIDAFSSNPTQLILDLSSYFAP